MSLPPELDAQCSMAAVHYELAATPSYHELDSHQNPPFSTAELDADPEILASPPVVPKTVSTSEAFGFKC